MIIYTEKRIKETAAYHLTDLVEVTAYDYGFHYVIQLRTRENRENKPLEMYVFSTAEIDQASVLRKAIKLFDDRLAQNANL